MNINIYKNIIKLYFFKFKVEKMENKNVGYILLGVSILIVMIIFMFKNALIDFVDSSCSLAHG